MEKERWQTVLELYRAASAMPAAEARAFVESQSSGAVAAEVLELLAAEEAPETPVFMPEPGTLVGRYRLGEELGRGGMGRVYAAQDTELHRPVALKFLATDAPHRLMREAQAASALNHPHAVTVHEVIRSGRAVAIVMEKVDGAALRSLLGEPWPAARVADLGRQVAGAIGAAHTQGIIHRDLKPENIMLRPDGYVKVLDFGLARVVERNEATSRSGLPLGTWRYMSPEQIRAAPVTPASDIFSLGLILYEATTGRHPFPADSPLSAAHFIMTRQPPPLSSMQAGVPRELEALILAMLRREPEARPSAAEVCERLAAFTVRPSASASRAWAAVALLLATVAGAALWWRTRTPEAPPALQISPYTTDAGVETEAEISPAGADVVYVCTSAQSSDICLQPAKGGPVRRLESAASDERSPTWSPDGRAIAFLRATRMERHRVVIATLPEMTERVVAEINSAPYILGRSLRWAQPDRLIVSANLNPLESFGLFSISTENGQMRQITTPPALGRPFGDGWPAISPDGHWLAFSRVTAVGTARLHLLPLDGQLAPAGEPQVVETGRPWSVGPAWTAGGQEILFATGIPNRMQIARLPASGRGPVEVLVSEQSHSPVAGPGFFLYTRSFEVADLWQLPARPFGTPATPLQLTQSASRNVHPSYSPDGRRVAFISDRTGFEEVWAVDRDGKQVVQWTALKCEKVAIPRWSSDSRRITFSAVCGSKGDVYVVDAPGARPRAVSDSPGLDEHSRWVPGKEEIYFTSFRTGVSATWKAPAGGGPNMPVGEQITSNPTMAPDGQSLYFTRLTDGYLALWRMPVEGAGAETLVVPRVGDYVVNGKGIFFTAHMLPGIHQLDPATGRTVRFNRLPDAQYIFDAAPDGLSFVFSRAGFSTTDLMKAEYR